MTLLLVCARLLPIQRWLNRLLALRIETQNAIFEEYMALIQARIDAARVAQREDAREPARECPRELARGTANFAPRPRVAETRRDWRREWNRDSWRNDRRYDWQNWRYRNRNSYRLAPYYSPYRNHRYSRFSIGTRRIGGLPIAIESEQSMRM